MDDVITHALNIRPAQNLISDREERFWRSDNGYFFPKNFVCVASSIAVSDEIHANELTLISERVVIFVARLKADRALVLSKIPSSVNPAVLSSMKKIIKENKNIAYFVNIFN